MTFRRGRAARPSARAAEVSELAPFAIEVQRREHVAIVQPRGELDLSSVQTLRSTLDAAISETLRAVLDDGVEPPRTSCSISAGSPSSTPPVYTCWSPSTSVSRDSFLLTLLAPAAPVYRTIQLCGSTRCCRSWGPDDAAHGEPPCPPAAIKAFSDARPGARGPRVRRAGRSQARSSKRGSAKTQDFSGAPVERTIPQPLRGRIAPEKRASARVGLTPAQGRPASVRRRVAAVRLPTECVAKEASGWLSSFRVEEPID